MLFLRRAHSPFVLSAAKAAEDIKCRKHASLASSGYHFAPFSVETSSAIALIKEDGCRIAYREDDSPFSENFPCHRPRKRFQYPWIWQERQTHINWCMTVCPRQLPLVLFVYKVDFKFHNYMCVKNKINNGHVS